VIKGIGSLVLVLALALMLSGCASVLPNGILYTEVKAPIGAGEGDVSYSKVGVAKATSVLGLVATGDASIKAAMENGGIRRIKYVDYDAKNILGLFGEYTTTVYGD
jgi:uncharacterized protein YceK